MLIKSIKKSNFLHHHYRTMSYVTNLHQAPSFYVNGVKYINDFDIEEYRPQIQAFLTKRRTTKREVPPKAWVIKDMGNNYTQEYFQQRMVPGEILYEQTHLKRLYDSDVVNSQYLHSVFCEEYQKNLFEALCQKQIMNGSVPSIIDKPKEDNIRKQGRDLQDVFYKGDKLSPLEYDIERMYISEKMEKHQNYKKR